MLRDNRIAPNKEALAKDRRARSMASMLRTTCASIATIPQTTEAMKDWKKAYDPVTYAGAGHGFMRARRTQRAGADRRGRRGR